MVWARERRSGDGGRGRCLTYNLYHHHQHNLKHMTTSSNPSAVTLAVSSVTLTIFHRRLVTTVQLLQLLQLLQLFRLLYLPHLLNLLHLLHLLQISTQPTDPRSFTTLVGATSPREWPAASSGNSRPACVLFLFSGTREPQDSLVYERGTSHAVIKNTQAVPQ